jgi:hypothetical protein
MPSLHEQQARFGGALLSAGGSPGMQIYRDNVFGNWSKALAGAYPIVRKIVGAEFFKGLAREYARAYPSASGDMNEYGAQLAGFVASFPHTQDLPYLPDVARMEWLAHLAYYAADARPFEINALSQLPENPRLQLAPSCALLRSDWPLARLWEMHQDGFAGEFSVDFSAGVERILIHRPDWRVQVRSIALGDFRFLAGAGRGETLGAALEAACALDAAFDASTALATWVQARAVTL